ncbi:zinc-dependent alcohol dehydrogenase family protein [Cohnella caldifontis]|uniref:zinc-dependent alcohol dehydrogenase family protein n=1 Tax=Cohnella caldifontis TaxID=3027471 RepID=UPI0023EC266D|nr:zinc-dependent alcohol dehydrogenase family protein [Cohnella sp. YIM B05605]
MKALVIEKPHQAIVKEVEYPAPGPGEVTIRVERVGICGTDFHIYEGEFLSPYPIIPGHEFSGTIHEVGAGVIGYEKGDRVTADPSLFCGACEFCLTNRGNQCRNWGALGNTTAGCMAEYVKVPAKNVVKLPDSMSFEEGAFIEPMACVVHGMNRLSMKAGDRVILFGAGAMGQQLIQAISHAGASQLVVVDVARKKLDLAMENGATHTVLSGDLKKTDFPNGFDVVVDVTGIPKVIENAFEYMGATAKYLQFGVTATDAVVPLRPFDLYNKDWTLIGSMAINHTFLPAFHWVKEGRFTLRPLVSKVISLEETAEFLALPKDPDLFKVQIQL